MKSDNGYSHHPLVKFEVLVISEYEYYCLISCDCMQIVEKQNEHIS
jgi:hypothetical protein